MYGCLIIALAVLLLVLLVRNFNKDHFTLNSTALRQVGLMQPIDTPGCNCGVNTAAAECKIDEDCKQAEFCYMGRCWRYWRGQPMPWSTCRSPYCGCTEPGCTCTATDTPGDGTCTPYCKCTLNRRPGGSISRNCFPKCGTPCVSNADCPMGCPACSHGVCSAPNIELPVL